MKYVCALAVMLALAGALEWHGHNRGYEAGVADTNQAADKKVNAAKATAAEAIAARDATALTLANVERTLSAKKDELKLANFYADAAMDESAGLRKKLATKTTAREIDLRKAAHDSPACADLARLPICPAVAERLWGKAFGNPADARR